MLPQEAPNLPRRTLGESPPTYLENERFADNSKARITKATCDASCKRDTKAIGAFLNFCPKKLDLGQPLGLHNTSRARATRSTGGKKKVSPMTQQDNRALEFSYSAIRLLGLFPGKICCVPLTSSSIGQGISRKPNKLRNQH